MFGMTLIGANMLFIAQYLQLVAGLSPLHAGLWMLPGVAVNETGSEFGFALGIATLGSPGAAVYRALMANAVPAEVPQPAADAARDTLAGATVAAANLADPIGTLLLMTARDAFTSGM